MFLGGAFLREWKLEKRSKLYLQAVTAVPALNDAHVSKLCTCAYEVTCSSTSSPPEG